MKGFGHADPYTCSTARRMTASKMRRHTRFVSPALSEERPDALGVRRSRARPSLSKTSRAVISCSSILFMASSIGSSGEVVMTDPEVMSFRSMNRLANAFAISQEVEMPTRVPSR